MNIKDGYIIRQQTCPRKIKIEEGNVVMFVEMEILWKDFVMAIALTKIGVIKFIKPGINLFSCDL